MTNKYKLSKYLLVLIFFSHGLLAAKKLPDNFYINYELFQFIKLRNVDIEKTKISSGEIKLEYKSKKNQYDLNVQLRTKNFLKFYGDKRLNSLGAETRSGLLFKTFIVNNIKRPKKNIRVVYDRKKDKLQVDYKKKGIEKKFVGNLLDIPTLILQFHFEKSKSKYSFDFTEGKKIRKIEYKKIKNENLKINGKEYITELYEGQIPLAKNSKHYVWLSNGIYRIPIKIRFKMNGGLMVDQNLKKTDLKLKK